MATPIDTGPMSSPMTLPNGAIIPNRLVKVAMVEGIGTGGGLPDYRHRRLYKRWGEGGWGMIITGNCQVDPRHLATGQDRTFASHSDHTVRSYSALRSSTLSALPHGVAPPALLVQLSHGGLQSSSTINFSRWPWEPAVAPSVARPDTGVSWLGWIVGRVIWPTCSRQVVDFDEWEGIVEMFVKAAETVEKAGWDGVQVHSAHGYLLAEYLSPLTNPNVRPLPDVPAHIPLRLHLLWKILQGITTRTDTGFIKAVKINCSDFVQGGLEEDEAAEYIKEIVSWGLVDILEISGGNYSSPAFTVQSSPRESLFGHFTRTLIPQLTRPPNGPAILLTGGLHSRSLIADALSTNACDLTGIGRPSCVYPTLPLDVILNPDVPDDKAVVGDYTIPWGERMKRVLGGGSSSAGGSGDKKVTVPVATYIDQGQDENSPLLSKSRDKAKEQKKDNKGIPLIGAGVSTFWHEWQMSRMGRGVEPDVGMNWLWGGAIWEMIVWGLVGAFIGLFKR